MIDEAKRTRAQYLNGLAVAVIGIAASAVVAGGGWWIFVAGVAASMLLHWAAVRLAR